MLQSTESAALPHHKEDRWDLWKQLGSRRYLRTYIYTWQTIWVEIAQNTAKLKNEKTEGKEVTGEEVTGEEVTGEEVTEEEVTGEEVTGEEVTGEETRRNATYLILAAELIMWSMDCRAKFHVINSMTGLVPACAAPTPNPDYIRRRLEYAITKCPTRSVQGRMKVRMSYWSWQRRQLICSPVKPISLMGESITRSGPNFASNPLVTL